MWCYNYSIITALHILNYAQGYSWSLSWFTEEIDAELRPVTLYQTCTDSESNLSVHDWKAIYRYIWVLIWTGVCRALLSRVKDNVNQRRKANLFVKRGIYWGLNCFVFRENSFVSPSPIVCRAVQHSCGFANVRASKLHQNRLFFYLSVRTARRVGHQLEVSMALNGLLNQSVLSVCQSDGIMWGRQTHRHSSQSHKRLTHYHLSRGLKWGHCNNV